MTEAMQRPRRSIASDDQVKEFIRQRLEGSATSTKTRMLQQLRESGIACEQSRFARLYAEVRSW